MATKVVVLGAGYAGAGTINDLQEKVGPNVELTWVADKDYHLVLHESHRCIRDPNVQDKITIPVGEIADPGTEFIKGEVTNVDVDEQVVELADDTTVDYDYVVVAMGSQTAYYGIPGMAEHSLTLKNLDDALEIHEQVKAAAENATRDDRATVVVGGAGLSGIQSAGEIAEFRDKHRAPMDIYLVEALEEIFPPGDAEIQGALRKRLEDADIEILTNDPITEAEEGTIHFDEGEPLDYDVFLWTGGITGHDCMDEVDLENEHNRVNADMTFQTSDENVFAIGDSAVIEQPGERPAPPTAQAAWQAAEVAAENVVRAINGQRLESWTHNDKGTVVSIGDKAVAHDVDMLPISTFGGFPAETLKKLIAARWIATVTSWNRARKSWDAL
ncbi:NAD(P)/FAD-dependent oxidoreductase [Haloarchaeobius sp. HME9146]|uniref:NAD(P)/FAD-dependent oxidoreductase n=1 Tax=Haloarchaeobius sp. HME9146 TaxID=2978732 RepID=UPI0021C1DBE3|nr:NAD(P)/FAD-dependent oxidoreductase [Haloarchaeobius sp. HME9146]MCT9097226.1 NAD(P)/FAD-dependent oxidoreductase [Haloarchaeobius sp. HME9146]